MTTPATANAPEIAAALAHAHRLWQSGDRAAAIGMLNDLAGRAPSEPAVSARLGAYALDSGDYTAARSHLARAIERARHDPSVWINLGTASLHLGDVDAAIGAYREALALDPASHGATINLGNALARRGDLDEAVAVLEAARVLRPQGADIHNNLGNLYKEQGRFDDAFAAYESACRVQPDFKPAFSNLLSLTKLSTRHSPNEIFALHRAFAARFEPQWRSSSTALANEPDPERRLRTAYLSPDCHTALPAFVEPVIAAHDRDRFEIFAYFNHAQPAQTLAAFGAITPRVMHGASDDAVAQWIRDDRIDLLIDIAGHTGHNRLGVAGRKPAPVQFTWLDYVGTTGLDGVDYRITDAFADPPGASDALHSEKLIRLPDTQWCWRPPDNAAAATPLPALRNGHVTLGSFNNYSKLTDATLACWARVLAAIPDATLVIVGAPAGSAQTRVRAAFGRVNAADRLQVAPRVTADSFRDAMAVVDIALDPMPFSGATTTLEALWQGLPVVTLPGDTSASRSTASMLTSLGIVEWIARDVDGYVAIVERAARDLQALSALRAQLPARLRASALCDAERFTRALEAGLRDAWRRWCAR